MTAALEAKIRSRLPRHLLESATGIHQYEPYPVILGVDRPVVVVSCYSDSDRTICDRWRDAIVVHHNSYLLSFADNVGALALSASSDDEFRHRVRSYAKKLVAEQMHRISASDMARVLFLETVYQHEPAWRRLMRVRQGDASLSRSSRALTRLVADYLLHHEIGHVASSDSRYAEFVTEPVKAYLSGIGDAAADISESLFENEAYADIFGLNCCLASHARHMAADTLRQYLLFAVRTTAALDILYALASDLHRINVDPDYAAEDATAVVLMWMHREALMSAYLESFSFAQQGIACLTVDSYLQMPSREDWLTPMLDNDALVGCENEDARRFAEVVSRGFEGSGRFEAVIAGTRSSWLLGDDSDCAVAKQA